MDSGIEYTEDRYGPTPPQLGGQKRHADDDTLQRPYRKNAVGWPTQTYFI